MTEIKHVTAETFHQEVILSELPVLVEFYTSWCPSCKAMNPALETLAAEFDGRARILKVDVENQLALGERFHIAGVPTLVFFKDGSAVGGMVGGVPIRMLREKLETLVDRIEQAT